MFRHTLNFSLLNIPLQYVAKQQKLFTTINNVQYRHLILRALYPQYEIRTTNPIDEQNRSERFKDEKMNSSGTCKSSCELLYQITFSLNCSSSSSLFTQNFYVRLYTICNQPIEPLSCVERSTKCQYSHTNCNISLSFNFKCQFNSNIDLG